MKPVDHEIEFGNPCRPGQIARLARTARRARLGFHAVDFEMAKFGVRHQSTIHEHGATDTRAEGHDQDCARHFARSAEMQLRKSGRVGIVDGDDRAFETFGGQLIATEYTDSIAFAIMILILLVRPAGLLGGARA